MIQCDEARPRCRPCRKSNLACRYELSAGQTRIQVLLERQQHLEEELRSYTAFIHTLRRTDSNTSIQMLGRLRHGYYDEALLCANSAFRATATPANRAYPWENPLYGLRGHSERHLAMLPPNDTLLPVSGSCAVYPVPQPSPRAQGHLYQENPGLRAYTTAYTAPCAPASGLAACLDTIDG